ncbi:MAG: hypothetical protein WBQ68_16705 [Terriglobales bacterium]
MNRNVPKKIKHRKINRYVIKLWHSDGKTLQYLYVTKKQLEHLNAIEVGKEVFFESVLCFSRRRLLGSQNQRRLDVRAVDA